MQSDKYKEEASRKEDLLSQVKEYRFFPLENKQNERGDRFLMPWIYCHVFGANSKKITKGNKKRALKELNDFFNADELKKYEKQAADLWPAVIRDQIEDSAFVYLKISKNDPGFSRKLFGLLRMNEKETEQKLFRDIYGGMLRLLFELKDFRYRELMMQALDKAFLILYPERQSDVEEYLNTYPDPAMRKILRSQ